MTLSAGVRDALRVLGAERPAVVLGTGGYVCVPVFVAARMLRIPSLIYSLDIIPGLAVRTLTRIATGALCSFPPSLRWLPPSKTQVTGYPVRSQLFHMDREQSRAVFGLSPELPVVLVYGGSRGARAINQAIKALLPALTERAQVLHVCGREGDEEWLRAAADALPSARQARYHLHPYLSGTMSDALAAADLAVCRAGASTLAELPAVGLPAVLVPLLAVGQDANAAYLVDHGAAVVVPNDAMLGDGEATDGPLWQAIAALLNDEVGRATMSRQCKALAVPDAAERLADAMLALV